MKVSQYYEKEISNRPYKYQTKQNMVRCLKKLELWDMPFDSITPALCWTRLEGIFNQNVKRVYAGYLRNIFDYERHQIPIIMGYAKTYDLPTVEQLESVINRSKYRLQLLLCMYAGLRIGEACAVVPKQVNKEGDLYFLNVDRAFSQDGVSLSSPKTLGKVLIPEWLALEVLNMKKDDYWKQGRPTKLVTTACLSLGRVEKVKINPHMLRHWFATDMARRNVPPHIIMKQMRHKNVQTAMAVYSQVNNADLINAMPTKPSANKPEMAKVVNLFNN